MICVPSFPIKFSFLLRNLNIQLARNGGSTGEVSVDFSAAYFLPGSDHPMPGTLTKSAGQLSFRNGEG